MASIKKRLPVNQKGEFFVDSTCINCANCRILAPEIYKEHQGQSFIGRQPRTPQEIKRALWALTACPSSSIGTESSQTEPFKKEERIQISHSFPIPIEQIEQIEEIEEIKQIEEIPIQKKNTVFYCGYNSHKSFGASSYLILREKGNVMVDSPRYSSILKKNIEDLGGISYHYLTHKDDVADHQKYHEVFHTKRILHVDDLNKDIPKVEIPIEGNEVVVLDSDLYIIPVPGHTKGHTVLLYQNFLFTGDHLAFSPQLGHLYAFYDHCWYSWTQLVRSTERLLDYSFEWVLPGHGFRFYSQSMKQELQKTLDWMHGKARQGKARQGKARQGKARQGKARQGKACLKIKQLLL